MAFTPDYTVHPGKSLAEALQDRGMTQGELSLRSELTEKHINQIINGKASISPDTAIIFEHVLGIEAAFWNSLQKNYDETTARLRIQEKHKEELGLLPIFRNCYNELVKYNYIKKKQTPLEQYKSLLEYFGVNSLLVVEKTEAIAYRKITRTQVDAPTLSGWLRLGNIYIHNTSLPEYNEKKLKDSLNELRAVVGKGGDKLDEKIEKLLVSCGVGMLFSPYFAKTNVHGATRWLGDNPLIQLSLRGKKYDGLCFTLFHEIGHILLHGKRDQFIEYEGQDYLEDPKEKEANDFASDKLLPKDQYESFVNRGNFSPAAIKSFSARIGMDEGIVAGRLAKDKYITRPMANRYRREVRLKG